MRDASYPLDHTGPIVIFSCLGCLSCIFYPGLSKCLKGCSDREALTNMETYLDGVQPNFRNYAMMQNLPEPTAAPLERCGCAVQQNFD